MAHVGVTFAVSHRKRLSQIPLPGALLSCSGKKASKEAGIGAGLSVRSRAQTALPR